MAAHFSEFRIVVDICRVRNTNGKYYNYFTDADFECDILD